MKVYDLHQIPNLAKGHIIIFRWKTDGFLYYKNDKAQFYKIPEKNGTYTIENLLEPLGITNINNWTDEGEIKKINETLQELIFRIEPKQQIIQKIVNSGSDRGRNYGYTYVDSIIPSVNGQSNFFLTNNPTVTNNIILSVNGQEQYNSTDFSIIGNHINWLTKDFLLETTDTIRVYYS